MEQLKKYSLYKCQLYIFTYSVNLNRFRKRILKTFVFFERELSCEERYMIIVLLQRYLRCQLFKVNATILISA